MMLWKPFFIMLFAFVASTRHTYKPAPSLVIPSLSEHLSPSAAFSTQPIRSQRSTSSPIKKSRRSLRARTPNFQKFEEQSFRRKKFRMKILVRLLWKTDNTYLIFVISFTQAGFFNPKFLHPKTMQNTQKLQQIPPKSVKYAVLCVQSGKFYTGQNFFTRALPVVPATNMRYAYSPLQDVCSHSQYLLIGRCTSFSTTLHYIYVWIFFSSKPFKCFDKISLMCSQKSLVSWVFSFSCAE